MSSLDDGHDDERASNGTPLPPSPSGGHSPPGSFREDAATAFQFPAGADPISFLLGSPQDDDQATPVGRLSALPSSPSLQRQEPPSEGRGSSPRPATTADFRELTNTVEDLGKDIRDGFRELREVLKQGTTPASALTTTVTTRVANQIPLPHLPPPTKLTELRKNRPRETLDFQAEIRKYLKLLLKNREVHLDPRHSEAQAWAEKEDNDVECCDAGHFRIFLGSSPRHPWNRSAARVFADTIIADESTPFTEDDRRTLISGFFVRVRSLVTKYRRESLADDDMLQQLDKEKRRRQRKAELHQRRLWVTQNVTELQRHSHILKRLGVDGMSSDEEVETTPYTRQYHVRLPRWRGRQLGRFLHTLDMMYALKKEDYRRSRGNLPHTRIRPSQLGDSGSYAEGQYVSALPRNAYHEQWLDERGEREIQERIRPSPENYDFVHDPQIYE
ncbi:hypothetical protein K435DRAFT_865819 [Dendrothele bispora CBS 962.96]|uniref:Uncharacterized protein n=1 Tax=Dendrothele bispora (strain CBS 962.96) TaxID=1314807 RepID=A0A4S8LIF4_DENBC|nr:hypothetical protein K435DRAFT_865819 [Dendrothele bispora CBS 962.96]